MIVTRKDMREYMLTANHSGGRDAVLREAAVVCWLGIHREIIEKANNL